MKNGETNHRIFNIFILSCLIMMMFMSVSCSEGNSVLNICVNEIEVSSFNFLVIELSCNHDDSRCSNYTIKIGQNQLGEDGCPPFSTPLCPTHCDPTCHKPLRKRSSCKYNNIQNEIV